MERQCRPYRERISENEYVAHRCISLIIGLINKLRRIALNKNVLSCKDYLKQMIDMEMKHKNHGYQTRIQSLRDMNKQIKIIEKIENDKIDFKQLMKDAQKAMNG